MGDAYYDDRVLYDEDDYGLQYRRGRASPIVPVVYPASAYGPGIVPRPTYYGGGFLAPEVAVPGHRRARSYSGSGRSYASSPPAAPVIINKIYNDYDSEDDDRHRHGQLVPPRIGRSRSGSVTHYSRTSSRRPTSYHARDERDYGSRERRSYSREDWEREERLRQTEKELDKFKQREERELREIQRVQEQEDRARARRLEREEREKEDKLKKVERELERFKQREEAEKLKEEELRKAKLREKEAELQKVIDERRAKEEADRLKREKQLAIEDFKREEAEKTLRAKKEREEREREYQSRLEADMRKMGLHDTQISQIAQSSGGIDPNRPMFTRMARKYISIETLNHFNIDYQYDQVCTHLQCQVLRLNIAQDPECVLIRRVVPQWEQDRLWQHTKALREARRPISPVFIAIEDRHGKHRHHETELQFVREKKHTRKPSPSALLTWVAGGPAKR